MIAYPQDLHGFLGQFSLDSHEVSRYQLIQGLLRMARMELEQNPPLVLGEDGGRKQSSLSAPCPIGHRDACMCVLAWTCLDNLCQPLHGSVEKITNEVPMYICD